MTDKVETKYLPGWLGYTDDPKLKEVFQELREIKERRALTAMQIHLVAATPSVVTTLVQSPERMALIAEKSELPEEVFEIAFAYDTLPERITEDHGRRALGIMLRFPAIGSLPALNRKYKYDFGLDECTSLPKLIEAIHERVDFVRTYNQLQELKKQSAKPEPPEQP